MSSLEHLAQLGPDHAIEIAPRIWWVGHALEGDPFQCHAYLIEHGAESVLIDPGSQLTIESTLTKVKEVIDPALIKYFVCHHQDPDICGALPMLDSDVAGEGAQLVTHKRAAVLLRHLALAMETWEIEENKWSLDLGGRHLEFIFTPYMHFPGAFCTFDSQTGTLFSSDIFGGFTDGWQLVARDETHFESLRPFHEHYMPSTDILQHGLAKLEILPIELIAPQHGSLIPKRLVSPIMERLKTLECGLYLSAEQDTSVVRLSRINALLRDIIESHMRGTEFKDVASCFEELMGLVLPVRGLDVVLEDSEHLVWRYRSATEYSREHVELPPWCGSLLRTVSGGPFEATEIARNPGQEPTPALLIPLVDPGDGVCHSVLALWLKTPHEPSGEATRLIERTRLALEVTVRNESFRLLLQEERGNLGHRLRELKRRHQADTDASRDAGAAEASATFLHEVGNRLNGALVSTSLLQDSVGASKLSSLGRLSDLLEEHGHDLPSFFGEGGKGKAFSKLMAAVTERLQAEREQLVEDLGQIRAALELAAGGLQAQRQDDLRAMAALTVQSLDEAIASVLDPLRASAPWAHIRVTTEFSPIEPFAFDSHKLRQILGRLLSNAARALGEPGTTAPTIVIRTEPAGTEWVRVIISDNGPGIEADRLERVFGAGVSTWGRRGDGLHWSANAVGELGGRLTAASEGLGLGTTFAVELPRSEAEAAVR